MRLLFLWLSASLFLGCNPQPKEIVYNEDECAYCKMKISNPQFGAELVTDKGKVFKYDSGECLLNDYIGKTAVSYSHILVTDFRVPFEFIDARNATFLISEAIPSPMGAYLSTYSDLTGAKDVLGDESGEFYSFNEIEALFRSK